MDDAASPLDVEDLRARVRKALDAFLGGCTPALDGIGPETALLGDAVVSLLSGGKRLRPAFCYWGWRAAGGPDCEEIVRAATALELVQGCALIHDDVMDGSDTRRGQPAVHRRFATLHRSEGWRGDPEAFGTGAAILAGDLCLTWADELLFASGLPMETLLAAKPVYDAMRTELMAGQYLDLLEQAVGGGSVPRAERVIRYKSARYTVERPLHLGAVLAGGPPEVVDALRAYGAPLGEAFQLRDDVLGVFGDPAETGKPAGDDLREGKQTVLVALTLERATPQDAATLRRLLGDPHLSTDGVRDLRQVIASSGALDRVEELIAERTERAVSALAGSPVTDDARAVLAALAVAATERRG